MRLLALLSLAAALGGCHRPEPAKYVRALERMAEVADRHRGDCAAMGRALKRFFAREGEAIRDWQEHSGRLTKRERAELEGPSLGPRVEEAMKRLMPAHKRCMEHEEVREAYLSL